LAIAPGSFILTRRKRHYNDRDKEMDKKKYHVAKAQLVAGMLKGQSWQVAAASAGLQISQSNAYRLWLAVRQRGESALQDGRHGHPIKLRGAARTFLEEQCREAPHTPSSTIQVELRERFDLSVSISQINRVRAALRISNHPQNQEQEKNRQGKECGGEHCDRLRETVPSN
jgi:transposase